MPETATSNPLLSTNAERRTLGNLICEWHYLMGMGWAEVAAVIQHNYGDHFGKRWNAERAQTFAAALGMYDGAASW